jgi:hypothetical protein
MATTTQLFVLVSMAALLAALQLPGASSQSIYRGILLSSGLGNFSCSSKATRVLEKTITVSPANICKSFGMGNANVLTCTGKKSGTTTMKTIHDGSSQVEFLSATQVTASIAALQEQKRYAACR